MANFSITVTNALFFEGPSYPTIWNAFTWGQENWGNVSDLGTNVTHAVDTSLTLDSSFNFSFIKITDESLSPVSEVANYVTITIDNTLTFLIDMGSETLRDGNGWYYVYPDNTTELEDRISTDWTDEGGTAASWTTSASPSTTWSAA